MWNCPPEKVSRRCVVDKRTFNLLEQSRNVVVVKRQLAAEEDEHDDSGAPDVDLWARI